MRFDQGNTPQNSLLTAASVRLGITGNALYKYIIGQTYPTLRTVRRIEAEFGWPIDAQVRLMPEEPDLGYGTVLAEVLREHFPDIEPGFSGTGREVPRDEPRYNPAVGGWTQAFIAGQIGIRVSSVTRWLNGARYPEARTMLRIERLFGWPATEQIALITEDGYEKAYGVALRDALDRAFPTVESSVTKITPGKV